MLSVVLMKAAIVLNWFSYSVFGGPLGLTYMREFSLEDSLFSFDVRVARTVFAFLMICGIAVAIKLLKEWYAENRRRKETEKEKLAIELEMLKAQVHPHFLFNTLNNLYSLTLTKSDKAPVVVTHLSDLLRYMLYECNEKEVALSREIEVLREYAELEKLRYGNRIDVGFTIEGNIYALKIAPLLLLPFAENCFKHGVNDELDQCWVNIYLHAEQDGLSFIMSNSFSKAKQKNEMGGIGLRNISKRLELLYPGKYELQMNADDETFTVKLQIKLVVPSVDAAAKEPSKKVFQPQYT